MSIPDLISIAPMVDCTDRHFRYFMRLIAKHVLLYTEMVPAQSILYHKDRDYLLRYHPAEHPLAIQLGGSDPQQLATCAKIAVDYGYDAINLNVGCPSERVQQGHFGACLMAQPQLVAECVHAMRQNVAVPVTVKTRIGIDEHGSFTFLKDFITTVAQAGCKTFIIHARKAWLKGLNPKQNRQIPPLHYDVVYRLKQELPELRIVINGGIQTIDAIQAHLNKVDGVMLGRAAYANPYLLAEIDHRFYAGSVPIATRHEIMDQMLAYIESELALGTKLNHMVRHILGLFQGVPGAKAFRRYLSECGHQMPRDIGVVKRALACVI